MKIKRREINHLARTEWPLCCSGLWVKRDAVSNKSQQSVKCRANYIVSHQGTDIKGQRGEVQVPARSHQKATCQSVLHYYLLLFDFYCFLLVLPLCGHPAAKKFCHWIRMARYLTVAWRTRWNDPSAGAHRKCLEREAKLLRWLVKPPICHIQQPNQICLITQMLELEASYLYEGWH